MPANVARLRRYSALRNTVLSIAIAAFACLMMLLRTAAADELAELRQLGFDFPSEINGFARGSITNLEPEHPGLGYTVAYHGEATVTVYVYDLGVRDIPEGPSNAVAQKAFQQAAREVLGSEGHFGRVKVELAAHYVAKSPAGEAQYLCAEFVLRMADGAAERSYLYVTGANSKFFKMRVTFPTDDATTTTAREFADAAASTIVQKRP